MAYDNFELFFKANQNRIHYQIHRLNVRYDWRDEFFTEGIVALWAAYQDYDDAKGDVGTFLNFRIRYRLIDLLRKKIRDEERDEEIIQQQTTNMTSGTQVRHATTPLPDKTGLTLKVDSEEKAAFWESIQAQLTDKQWKWVKYFIIADLSIKEIMEIEDVSADAVKNWGRSARKKLKRDDIKIALKNIIADL